LWAGQLDQGQRERLRAYAELLADRGAPLGLIGESDRGRVWERHVEDSLRAVPCLNRAPPGPVVDLGSGAGLPGIPVAVAAPHRQVVLVEPRARAVGFLELAVERLGLGNVRVFRGRAEDAQRAGLRAVAVLARALAPVGRAWEMAAPLLVAGGCLVYFAGARRGVEALAPELGQGVEARVCSPGVFPWQGPVVIIRRAADRSVEGPSESDGVT
jgi:16S rRNA (guanine527-N7)-methyltransferase